MKGNGDLLMTRCVEEIVRRKVFETAMTHIFSIYKVILKLASTDFCFEQFPFSDVFFWSNAGKKIPPSGLCFAVEYRMMPT